MSIFNLSSWWNDQREKADRFLETGELSDVVRNPLLNDGSTSDTGSGGSSDFSSLGGGCTSSAQCPAGFACVNGACTKMGPSPGTIGSSAGPGDCDPNNPNNPCNSGGPNSCSQTPNCGDIPQPKPQDCCEKRRCCRYSGFGVSCNCGPCSPLPNCNKFCQGYSAANGEDGAGCSSGPNGNSCDECSFCEDGKCKPANDGPCHCGGGTECDGANCEKCDTDPNSVTFGTCQTSLDNCKFCHTIYNYKCPCGQIVPVATGCVPAEQGKSAAQAKAKAIAKSKCNAQCPPDQCKPSCQSFTRCTDTGTGVAACLSGETQTGSMTVHGDPEVTCVFCEKCGDPPPECKDCDCNCHNDCADCEICNASGECVPDPNCDDDECCTDEEYAEGKRCTNVQTWGIYGPNGLKFDVETGCGGVSLSDNENNFQYYSYQSPCGETVTGSTGINVEEEAYTAPMNSCSKRCEACD